VFQRLLDTRLVGGQPQGAQRVVAALEAQTRHDQRRSVRLRNEADRIRHEQRGSELAVRIGECATRASGSNPQDLVRTEHQRHDILGGWGWREEKTRILGEERALRAVQTIQRRDAVKGASRPRGYGIAVPEPLVLLHGFARPPQQSQAVRALEQGARGHLVAGVLQEHPPLRVDSFAIAAAPGGVRAPMP